jgi:chromosome segregation ATPase
MRKQATYEEALAANKYLRIKVKKLQGHIRELEDSRDTWKSKSMNCKKEKEALEAKLAAVKKKLLQIDEL